MTQDETYKAWWHHEGSGIIPLPNEDMEEFAHRMTQIAWSNGAFIEREACALVADESIDFWVKKGYPESAEVREAQNIAEAIRARGEA